MRKEYRAKIFKSFFINQPSLYKTATNKNEIVSYIKDIVPEEERNTNNLISADVVKKIYDRCISGKESGTTLTESLESLKKDVSDLIQLTSRKIKEAFSSNKESFKSKNVNEVISESSNYFFGIKEAQFNTFNTNKISRVLKLSFIYHQYIIKTADGESEKAKAATGLAKITSSYLTDLLSLIYKVCLGVGKEKNFLGYASVTASKPSAPEKKDEPGFFSSLKEKIMPSRVSHQTLFKVNPNYRDKKMPEDENWIIFFSEESGLQNDYESIKKTLMNWCNQVYSGVNKSALESSSSLEKITLEITKYNFYVAGAPFIYIPKPYRSKKQVVDFFIDDVADLAKYPEKLSPSQSSPASSLPSPSAVPPPSSQPKTLATEIDEDAAKKSNLPSNPSIPSNKKGDETYPIVISKKWTSELNDRQKSMLSKLTPDEQRKIEDYLNNMGLGEKFSVGMMSEDERESYFKKKVKEQLGDDAYRRVSS